MKKTDFASQLRRMQMHGWFDVLIKLLAIALAIGLGALVGQISYAITASTARFLANHPSASARS